MHFDKANILNASYQYQREWRFEKDKELMTQALEAFPDWSYAQQRMEWHSRPLFHPDPAKSKLSPRSLLNAPRNPNFIPQQQTIDTLCFVTGTNSNSPYFELTVQMIESIKATQHYKNVPINIFDFGMTQEHRNELITRFGAHVKDPAEVMDFSNFVPDHFHDLARRAELCRGNMAKIFPGFEYYYWLDNDTWIQDENAVDKMVFFAEKQGMSASIVFSHGFWGPGHYRNPIYGNDISKQNFDQYLMKRRIFHDDMFCIHKSLSHHTANYTHNGREKTHMITSTIFLHYTFYKYARFPSYVIDDPSHHFGAIFAKGAWTENGILNSDQHKPIGIISLMGHVKHYPYHMLFPRNVGTLTQETINVSKDLATKSPLEREEMAFQLCQQNGWKHDNYFFRRYPMNPEE